MCVRERDTQKERDREVIKIRSAPIEMFDVDYESIKRELKIKSIYECRCDERHYMFIMNQ